MNNFDKSDLLYPSSPLSCKVGHTERFCPSREMLIMSGDIELNPGPKEIENTRKSPLETLQIRLAENGLRYLDCGGEGDCFFRVISTKLYGSPDNHKTMRRSGVSFLMNNPKRFIESNTDIPWVSYLSNMLSQGTWADHLIIQAVADAMNLIIQIIESNETFSPVTIVRPLNNQDNPPLALTIGHLGEMHYVSTVPICDDINNVRGSSSVNGKSTYETDTITKNQVQCINLDKTDDKCTKNTERKTYIRDYMRKRRSNEKLKCHDNQIRSHRMTNIEKTRENNRIYQRKSREQNRSTEMGNELKRKSCQNVLPVEPKKQCMHGCQWFFWSCRRY